NHPSEVLEIGQTVQVKVLDIDRDRQRISLGLKQTQNDPWQQVLDKYGEGDVVEGRVTKVVTFGAFVEILPGVEGLVHISELAAHHVENPREIVSQGDVVSVKIIEMDAERRRLSLSLKRVEGEEPRRRPEGAPPLRLSEEVFSESRGRSPDEASGAQIDELPAVGDEAELPDSPEELDPTDLVAASVDEAELDTETEAAAEPEEPESELQAPSAEAEPETEAAAEPEEPESEEPESSEPETPA